MSETQTGLNLDISQRIKSLNIMSDYTSYIFPVSYIDLFITIDEFRTITQQDIVLVLTLKKLSLNDESDQLIDNYEYIFKDKVFDVVNEDNLIIQKTSSKDSEKYEQANLVTCRFALLAKEDITANKVNVYGNFINCDLGNVVSYLVTKLNQEKKTVIQDLDNTKVYDQITIPFNTALRNLVYLDTVYGLYKNGLKLFMDFNKNYILNKTVNDIKNYTKTITINGVNSESAVDPTTTLPNSMKVLTSNIVFTNNNRARKEAIGNDINSVIPSDNLRITKTNYEDNFDKTKVYYQTYSNPFTSNLLNPNNDTLVKISVINTDMDYFNFINDYLIEINTKEFEGIKFNMINYSHRFVKNKQGYYEMFSSASLRKIL